jgi:hypothetical protein
MLMVLGILLGLASLVATVICGFTGGNIETGESPPAIAFWPAWLLAGLMVACFVARHYLHGHAITF